jgi:sulfite dehydrogenase
MKKMFPIASIVAASAGLMICSAMPQLVAAKSITLPADGIAWRESPLPGYQKVTQQCMTCHSAHYAEYQATSTPRAYWEAQVKRMKAVFNAPVPDADIPLITDYLSKTYGAERSSAPR